MSLQIRFGIVGAALGLLIGLFGALVASPLPAGIFLLRVILAIIICGVLGLVLHIVINQFLPELLSESGGQSAEDLGAPAGHAVNITLPEDGPPIDNRPGSDQAEALRESVRQSTRDDDAGLFSGEESGDGDIIEEVSEDRRSRPVADDSGTDASFNEAAFYQGVERLPDIGGFSEQFQSGDAEAAESGEAGYADNSAVPTAGVPGKKKGAGSNMDPELIAQAIRTALKKEDL